MVKMQKMAADFLSADQVKTCIREHEKCTVTFIQEPELKENEKFGNKSYHARIKIQETGEETTWNMNGRSSDFLSDKFGGDTKDFVKQSVEIVTTKISTKDGLKDTIYPTELMQELE